VSPRFGVGEYLWVHGLRLTMDALVSNLFGCWMWVALGPKFRAGED
jgi:hypothetical protein